MSRDFRFPEDLRFTCSRCGDCCRSTNVQVSPRERETLEGLDWSGRVDELVGVEPTVTLTLRGERRRRLERHDDGACIYLGSENQCLLHEHFGAETKPLMCRLYPFSFYPVGDRVAVDCAFSCRAISHGMGERLEKRLGEWRQLVAEELGAPQPRRHRLDAKRPLDDEVLVEIEERLLAFLADEKLGLFDRMRCVLQYVRLATTGDPSTASARQLRDALAKGLPRQISKMPSGGRWDASQRALFFQWLYLALNPALANQDLLRGRRLAEEEKRRIAVANRYQRPELRPYVDNRELGASFETIEQVDAGYVEEQGAETVASLLRAKILGQRYLQAGLDTMPLVEAVPKLLLAYPMAIWTGKALAADRGAAAIEAQDLRHALRLLDRSIGQLATSRLPKKLAKVCDFLMLETDLVVRCRNSLLGVGEEEMEEDELELGLSP